MCTEHVDKAGGNAVTRRAAVTGGAALAASGVAALTRPSAAGAASPTGRAAARHGLVDLTHPLTTTFPVYALGEEAVRRTVKTFKDDGYYMQRWRLYEHTGTHVDAPAHFSPGGRYASQLTVKELRAPAAVIDISRRAARNPDTVVTVDDLRTYERRHGPIPRQAAVLMYSGWADKVDDPDAYRGVDKHGNLHFPGFGAEACEWLVRQRRVACLGVDTLSTDRGLSTRFAVHVILAEADRYGLENLAGLGRLPASGARITVGLIPFEKGSGGPARVVARW
jgi:kynurenine formamidase